MSKNLDLKKQVVSEIKEKLDRAQAMILVDYMGINVEQVTELRNKCREAGVEYKVYKNNLVKLATAGTPFEDINKDLVGPNAIIFGYDDPAVAAKISKKAAEDIEKLEVKSGVIEGVYFDVTGVEKIAAIPSRDELIAQFLRTVSAENLVGRFVRSINSPITNFTYLLANVAEQKN